MVHLNLIPKFNVKSTDRCQICVQAKQPRKPFKSVERNTSVLELVHSDLCEGNVIHSRGGKRYFITFIDDYSKFCTLYLIRTKDEALSRLMAFKALAENQTGKDLKRLRSNRGGEYTSNVVHKFCEQNGIIHELIAPYSPESNGVAERKNRTLLDMVNSMICSSGLPENLWGEALLTACHVLNCVPPRSQQKSPFEIWFNMKPDYSHLRVWGCLAKIKIPENKKRKIGPKTVDGVFVGYAENSIAYRFLIIKSDINGISENTIVEFGDAVFFEDIFPMKSKINVEIEASNIPS